MKEVDPELQGLEDQAIDLADVKAVEAAVNKLRKRRDSKPRSPIKRGRRYTRHLRADLRRLEKRHANILAAVAQIVDAKTKDAAKLKKIATAAADWDAKAAQRDA